MPDELNFDAYYTVEGHPGIAWYLLGYSKIRDADYEWSGIEYDDKEKVRAVMVGDDHVWIIEVEELTEIDEDAFCHGCGQIGCGH